MSSLASSPPNSRGASSVHGWARMQYEEAAHMSRQGADGCRMPQGGGGVEGYSMAEMAQMGRGEMSGSRGGVGGMYAGVGEGRGARGGQYGGVEMAVQMEDSGGGYRGCGGSRYKMAHGMPHMAADRDCSGDMDELADYSCGGPLGLKHNNSVSSAVREVATRMNQVRLGHGHKAHMVASHELESSAEADEAAEMAAHYAQRVNGSSMMMASMRERMAMGGGGGMMRGHGHVGGSHVGKMQHGAYVGGMMASMPMMSGGAGARMLKAGASPAHAELLLFQDSLMGVGGHGMGGMPYIAAQPPCLPFAGMHTAGYGVAGGGHAMGGAGGMEMMHAHAHAQGMGAQAAKHNKYCHFCQHVKVRASGMLACCNKDCTRRFCEHCLSKSIGDDVNPQTSTAWVGGQWHCPVCRKLCCCAIGDCDKNHRHCKAYRYRVRRAEQQAVKRAGTGAGPDLDAASPRDSPRMSGEPDEDDNLGEGGSGKGIKAEAAIEIAEAAVSMEMAEETARDKHPHMPQQAGPGAAPGRTEAKHDGGGCSLLEGHVPTPAPAPASSSAQREAAAVGGGAAGAGQAPRQDAHGQAKAQAHAQASGARAHIKTEEFEHQQQQQQLAGMSGGHGAAAGGWGAMAPGTCGGGGMHLGVALHAHASEAASLAQALALARQGGPRRDAGGMGGTGGHGVDVTDVQTMADSWLRLLEEEDEDLGPDLASGGEDGLGYDEASPRSGQLQQRMPRAWSRSHMNALGHLGSSDSLNRIMSGEEGGEMAASGSSQSLSELMQRQGSTPDSMREIREMAGMGYGREPAMTVMSRNVSNVSLGEMVRNYSSSSLEAVMEQGEGPPDSAVWPAGTPSSGGGAGQGAGGHGLRNDEGNDEMGGGDFDFLQGAPGDSRAPDNTTCVDSEEAGGLGLGLPHARAHHALYYSQQGMGMQASTGKRMQRTRSHNKLVHEAGMGRGMPRPASYEKLSRQCAAEDERLDMLTGQGGRAEGR